MIKDVIKVSEKAGKAILKLYKTDFKIETKSNNTPVTAADHASHNVLVAGLKKFGYPVLSEEDIPPEKERKTWSTYWIIDPLDGTKEFINKTGEFCVLIALIKDQKPVLSVTHIPITGQTFWAEKGKGAFLDGVKLPNVKGDKTVIGSRGWTKKQIAWVKIKHFGAKIIHVGSAIKFTKIAQGVCHHFESSHPYNVWDVAAGDLLIREAGGFVKPNITYDATKMKVPYFKAKRQF
jgi:3'(2'), 5'-bisphosphate nucleotidase